MEKEYSIEESDDLILNELAEDNSITNEEPQEEIEEEEPQQETEEEIEEVKPKKGIAKVLSQRNEARKEAETYKSEVEHLKEKLTLLEKEWNYWTEEYIQTLVDKRLAEDTERQDFFSTNENYKQYKKEIISFAKETWLSLDRASKLFLAENNPELLLDETSINKKQSKFYQTPIQTPTKVSKGWFSYSNTEFEELAKKWAIKF